MVAQTMNYGSVRPVTDRPRVVRRTSLMCLPRKFKGLHLCPAPSGYSWCPSGPLGLPQGPQHFVPGGQATPRCPLHFPGCALQPPGWLSHFPHCAWPHSGAVSQPLGPGRMLLGSEFQCLRVGRGYLPPTGWWRHPSGHLSLPLPRHKEARLEACRRG